MVAAGVNSWGQWLGHEITSRDFCYDLGLQILHVLKSIPLLNFPKWMPFILKIQTKYLLYWAWPIQESVYHQCTTNESQQQLKEANI